MKSTIISRRSCRGIWFADRRSEGDVPESSERRSKSNRTERACALWIRNRTPGRTVVRARSPRVRRRWYARGVAVAAAMRDDSNTGGRVGSARSARERAWTAKTGCSATCLPGAGSAARSDRFSVEPAQLPGCALCDELVRLNRRRPCTSRTRVCERDARAVAAPVASRGRPADRGGDVRAAVRRPGEPERALPPRRPRRRICRGTRSTPRSCRRRSRCCRTRPRSSR